MATQLLLADDSPTIAKILQMALASEPYEIRAVLTAEEALRELRANPPFLFLVDLSLPGKNGYEFARIVRHDSKLNKIRVVLLASAFEPVDEAEYLACGADGLIKKPFDPSELRATLRSIVETPAKYPVGSKVSGSLSGFMVGGEDISLGDLPIPAAASPPSDTLTALLRANEGAGGADADSILAGLLGGGPEPASSLDEATPAVSPSAGFAPTVSPDEPDDRAQFTNATIQLDLSGEEKFVPSDSVLDLSQSFDASESSTTGIDTNLKAAETRPPASEAGLSPNAEALAAFFAAEIASKNTPPPAPPKSPPRAAPSDIPPEAPPGDAFDASMESIEWGSGPAEASLNAWSSGSLKGQSSAPEAPPAAMPREGKTSPGFSPLPPKAAPPSARARPLAASPGANLMFDTGGSSFRFSEDYIHRITKSFAGEADETLPEESAAPEAPPFFPQRSDDRAATPPSAPTPSPLSGGGAWSDSDVQRIEKIVREEVQMVVREVAEKIAWEVIPELAENLIRKELDKVLKEMGQ